MKKTEYFINDIPFCLSKGFFVCMVPVYLDIETSNNHAEDPKDLITWVCSIQVEFNGHYYLLRTPEELIEFYKVLYKGLQLMPKDNEKFPKKVLTFIHNASYDLSYLIPYFREFLPNYGNNDGLIEGPNKFLTYVQGALEFRCTYRLSNMSLAKWSNEMNVEHKKQIGLYDYDRIIYQDSELSESDELYDKYDILSMKECLEATNAYNHDDLTSMPLTFTGYTRRILRKSCKASKYYRDKYFYKNRLTTDIFYAWEKSYAGGLTHNNRFYADQIIQTGKKYRFMDEWVYVPNIGHRDFKSHYPSQMTCYLHPLGVPQLIYDITQLEDSIEIPEILNYWPKFYTMSIIRFYDAEIKDKEITIPFMQFSKFNERNLTDVRLDNGRVIFARGEWVMYLDNIMLAILDEQYDLEYEVLKVWKIEAMKLPEEILSVVDKLFKAKSDHKNVVNELTEKYGKLDPRTVAEQFDLSQTKISLNSVYGCTCMNPIREQYSLSDSMKFIPENEHLSYDILTEGLEKYYKNHNNFLQYSIGCAVTSLAKLELYEYIKAIGYKNILYVDTDSAFYIKTPEVENRIEALNQLKKSKAHYVVLENGKKEYYDAFEPEPDCIAFKGLHSKCYGVVTSHGLELTIAGVPAKTLIGMDENNKPVYYTRESELSEGITDPVKALENLTDQYVFNINTGATAIYIGATGHGSERKPQMVNVNGHMVSTAGGCVISKLKSKKIKGSDYDLYSWEFLNVPTYIEMNDIFSE